MTTDTPAPEQAPSEARINEIVLVYSAGHSLATITNGELIAAVVALAAERDALRLERDQIKADRHIARMEALDALACADRSAGARDRAIAMLDRALANCVTLQAGLRRAAEDLTECEQTEGWNFGIILTRIKQVLGEVQL